MAFALSIKSKLDFPAVGNVFLVLTLIIASFTLLYSTLFLDIVLKKCGIADFCKADNFEESSLNKTRSKKNCFENFKSKIHEINENYLKRLIRNGNEVLDDSGNMNAEENRFYAGYGKRDNLRINEVKNSSTNEIKINNNIENVNNLNPQNIEILDKAEKRASQNLQLNSFKNRNANIYQNQIDEKVENLNSNFDTNCDVTNKNANVNNYNSSGKDSVTSSNQHNNNIKKLDIKNIHLFK